MPRGDGRIGRQIVEFLAERGPMPMSMLVEALADGRDPRVIRTTARRYAARGVLVVDVRPSAWVATRVVEREGQQVVVVGQTAGRLAGIVRLPEQVPAGMWAWEPCHPHGDATRGLPLWDSFWERPLVAPPGHEPFPASRRWPPLLSA